MIVALGFNKILKFRISIAHFSNSPIKISETSLYSPESFAILKNTGNLSHGNKQKTFRNCNLDPKSPPSFFQNLAFVRKDVIILDKGFYFFVGRRWIHSDKSSENFENSKKIQAKSDDVYGDGDNEKKKKRKKLKGKRAVVKWLKFFRWKKKKELERMTPEEKILFKLNKARKKELRLVEGLKKIEPADASEMTHDPEILTPEEHFFFLKMGIKGKNYVPVGRRGIYQGVILNMHLHWKKHQTVKVVVKTFSPEEVKEIASELARLTGGLVLNIHEENTIIMYRGKNYSQPPTEIMSPRVTLSRKKALDKSKYRDGLRAVRKHIPKLELDLKLLESQAQQNHMKSSDSVDNVQEIIGETVHSEAISGLNSENLGDVKDAEGHSKNWSDDSSLMDTGMSSDSENLSDMFETDSDTEADEKMEKPLYLKEFEKFAAESEGESEDLEDQLRQISMDSKEAKLLEKDVNSPEFDEVDRLFLRAASLLKKKRR